MAMTETPDLRTALERLRQVYDEVEFTDSDDPSFSQISRVDQGKLEDVIEALLVSHPPSPPGEDTSLAYRTVLFQRNAALEAIRQLKGLEAVAEVLMSVPAGEESST